MAHAPRILPALLVLLTHLAAQEEGQRLQAAYQAIDVYVDRLMTWHGTPGMAVAVTSRDRLLRARYAGHADVKSRRPVTRETLYQIGSITKSFTAIALLQQKEKGRFDPMKPVTAWLPWFSVKTTFAPITSHHLLMHTAGIPGNRDDMTHGPYQAWALREQETAWAPGERFHYSNVGYQVLHQVLQRVSGRPYAEVIRHGILKPLGMTHTEPIIAAASRLRQAIGYRRLYDDRPAHRSHPLVESQFVEYGVGDGCIAATTEDLAAYTRMLLARGKGPQGRVLSKESFARFIDGGKAGYGYGMGVRRVGGRTELRHSGGMLGITSQLAGDLDSGIGVVAFANGPGDPAKLARFALKAARSALQGKELPTIPDPSARRPLEKPERFSGSYQGARGRFKIVVEGGALVLVQASGKIPLEHVSGAIFQTPHAAFDRFQFRFAGPDERGFTYVTHGGAWYANERYQGKREFPVPPEWARFTGHYRSYSPWSSNFTVIVRRGQLLLVTAEGGETSVDEQPLTARPEGGFFVSKPPSPEVLRFDTVVDGRALRALFSGHVFHRTP